MPAVVSAFPNVRCAWTPAFIPARPRSSRVGHVRAGVPRAWGNMRRSSPRLCGAISGLAVEHKPTGRGCMSDDALEKRRSAGWTKQAVRDWSGRPLSELRLTRQLSSPPFPPNREFLRQRVNQVFSQRDPGYTPIQREDWQVSAESRIGDIRDLCHANR